jgi:hypothetical protein
LFSTNGNHTSSVAKIDLGHDQLVGMLCRWLKPKRRQKDDSTGLVFLK